MCDYCFPKIHSLLASALPCTLKCWPLLCQLASNCIQPNESTRKRSEWLRRERGWGIFPMLFPALGLVIAVTIPPQPQPQLLHRPLLQGAKAHGSQQHHFSPSPFILRVVTACCCCWVSMPQLLSHLCTKSFHKSLFSWII